ncbi:zinc finger protein 800b isoform X2 [Xyrichtys novacula]|uniref:Zinc finger protein 800b isoform X2 n=1 Tax=Xyrichtys novacula TaxID=13765 RepID=A0AAV1F265_XYRNO|nr:zinc finger protein 800b isoform X2 [Xyrichtys novacula]
MELQMETVCVCADAAPAEKEPIDIDPGGNNRRALPLSSSAPTPNCVQTRKIAQFIRNGWVSFTRLGMRYRCVLVENVRCRRQHGEGPEVSWEEELSLSTQTEWW